MRRRILAAAQRAKSVGLKNGGDETIALLDAGRQPSHGSGPHFSSHSSMDRDMSTDNASTEHVNAAHLRAFIERIEKLEEEKKALADDIKEVYGEAKGTGFDVKIIRKIVSIRKQDRDKRREEEEILDLYLSALGIE
jgi:uncharacterized protein (UPF0335 family)